MFKKKRNKFKKRRAIYLLVACQQDEKNVARELCISNATLSKWMKEPEFIEEYEKSMQRLEKHDSEYRAKQNKIISNKMYEEIHRRIATTAELKELPLSTLINKVINLNHEIRVDTPGDVTSRGEVKHKHELMDTLMDKYNQYQENIKNNSGHLHLVELPEKKDEDDKKKKKEASNG